MGVNSLRKTVTRQRRGYDLNPRPSAPESSTLTTRLPSHHECVVLCKDISLQTGRFCTRSLASCISRSSEDRSSWMFFIPVVRGGRLQFSGGGSQMAWLASAFSSIRARCPKKVRRRDLLMDESGGWLVMWWTDTWMEKTHYRVYTMHWIDKKLGFSGRQTISSS